MVESCLKMHHEKKGQNDMWLVRVQIRRSRFKNAGCNRLLLVNLVESRLPIGQALAGKAGVQQWWEMCVLSEARR